MGIRIPQRKFNKMKLAAASICILMCVCFRVPSPGWSLQVAARCGFELLPCSFCPLAFTLVKPHVLQSLGALCCQVSVLVYEVQFLPTKSQLQCCSGELSVLVPVVAAGDWCWDVSRPALVLIEQTSGSAVSSIPSKSSKITEWPGPLMLDGLWAILDSETDLCFQFKIMLLQLLFSSFLFLFSF